MFIISFLLPFLTYLLTLAPTMTSGDSGELITACYLMGIPHPPGYPIYCLVGKLFALLPIANIAYRVNLMSAFFGALSCLILYLIMLKIYLQYSPDRDTKLLRVCAFITAISFGFTSTYWSQSIKAEVYTIAVFFLLLFIYLFIDYLIREKDAMLFPVSYVFSLSIVSHYMSVMLLLPLAVVMISVLRGELKRYLKMMPLVLAGFLLGFLFYLYIPIRSLANPSLDWGNPENLKNFIWHITRQEYGPFIKRVFSFNLLFYDMKVIFGIFFKEFPWYMLIISGVGLLRLYFRNKRLSLFLTLSFLSCFSFYFIVLNISGKYLEPMTLYIERIFLLPSYVFITLWFGYGLYFLLEAIKNYAGRVYKFALFSTVCFPAILFNLNYFENDFSKNYFAYDYGVNILNTLEPNSSLIVNGDNEIFSLLYLTRVEKMRPDVTLYDKIDGIVFKDINSIVSADKKNELNGNPALILEILRQKTEGSVYFTSDLQYQQSPAVKSIPFGILYRVLREDERFDKPELDGIWHRYILRYVFSDRVYKDRMDRLIIANYFISKGEYFFLLGNKEKGKNSYDIASEIGRDILSVHDHLYHMYIHRNLMNESIKEINISLSLRPDIAEAYYDLGVIFGNSGRYEDAIGSWRKALSLKPDFKRARENIKKAEVLLKKTDTKKRD